MLFGLTDTLKIERCYQHGRGHLCRTKPGLLKLPKISSVLFGNNSFRYHSILSWNLLQNYLAINDMSTLALGRLKYLIINKRDLMFFFLFFFVLFCLYVFVVFVSVRTWLCVCTCVFL